MTKSYQVAVLGNWHLAFCSAAVLSHVGHRVALVRPEGHAGLRDFPQPPVQEPGLPEMIKQCQGEGRLDYWEGFQGWKADTAWLAIDTPVNDQDEPNVAPLIEAVAQLKQDHPECRLLMISSQIPIGFARELQQKFGIPVAYIPENLRLGKGIETFLRADRTVIGADLEETRLAVQDLMKGFQTEFLLCGLETSEMTKHATNAFLATSISFANELARIGEKFGVESQIVAKALKMDKRIGPAAYVAPGLGFAGGTLPRDLRVLQKIGKEKDVPTPLFNAVLTVNQETTTAVAEVALDRAKTLKRKPEVLVLGYTYKADTDTLRRSLSIEVAARLRAQGCRVWGYDPVMNHRDLGELDGVIDHLAEWGGVEWSGIKPDIILLMTARPVFQSLDWKAVEFPKGALLIDTQNFFKKDQFAHLNIDFKPLWSPLIPHQEKSSK